MLDLSKIVDIEVDGIDKKDYPDFCNAYISNAGYEISKQEFENLKIDNPDSCNEYNHRYFRCLTDDELDWLNDKHSEFVYDKVWKFLY